MLLDDAYDEWNRISGSLERSASLAVLTEAESSVPQLRSSYGGQFYGSPGEEWPARNGQVLFPLLQILVNELPEVPAALKNLELVTVFIAEEFPFEAENRLSSGLCIRTYSDTSNLVPLPYPQAVSQSSWKAYSIDWERVTDYPNFSDLERILDEDTAMTLCSDAAFEQNYSTQTGIKVGGWQYTPQFSSTSEDFVIQVDTESNYMFGDTGVAFFYFNNDIGWHSHWDSC